ncbi:outer membrane lipoprotein LolB [Massilia sp. TS11]|uniref:outer membrane lipoprotein LolB n=1 Tax=Massilia sp. TS11 TaxID=2908003 RepID=UPI001ED9CC52|nr:outer membrane lipoprotein LolB [Massilia sp. TS11]MCG2584921.1 outer membrane lipoprotein LolB [Massilia sp. TS11]
MATMFRTLFLCLLLAGCASAPATRPATPVAPYAASIAFAGRIGVQFINRDGQPDSQNARFEWRQQPGLTEIALFSPLGDTVATLTVTPQRAVLVQGKAAPLEAPDVDSLTARALGWSLPVSGLPLWVQGHARARDGSAFVASPAHDSVLTDDGWELRYVSWQEGASARPRRIDASRVTNVEAEKLTLRIVLDGSD